MKSGMWAAPSLECSKVPCVLLLGEAVVMPGRCPWRKETLPKVCKLLQLCLSSGESPGGGLDGSSGRSGRRETRWDVVVLRFLCTVLLYSEFVGSCSHFSTLCDGISHCQGDIPAFPQGSSGAWVVFHTFGLQDSKSEAS